MVSPVGVVGYESGASTGNALQYGAVVAATKDFSPTLSVGLGAAVFRQIYETQTFPFLAIDWQIDKNWKLSNPFAAGPTGPAGLELSYTIDEQWEAGSGAATAPIRSASTATARCPTASASSASSPSLCVFRATSDPGRRSTFTPPALPTGA